LPAPYVVVEDFTWHLSRPGSLDWFDDPEIAPDAGIMTRRYGTTLGANHQEENHAKTYRRCRFGWNVFDVGDGRGFA
jgi:hypothetical protein